MSNERFFILGLLLVFACSCKKENNNTPPPENPIPSAFQKNLMIEAFGGEWCANCVFGDDLLNDLSQQFPTQIIQAHIHHNDVFEKPHFQTLDNFFGVASFPRIIINRKPSTKGTQIGTVPIKTIDWEENIQCSLNEAAVCGILINSNLFGDSLSIEAQIHSKENISSDTRLVAYLVENNVPAISQAGAPNPQNYLHPYIYHELLTPEWGTSITLEKGNTVTINLPSIELSGNYNFAELYIIAFINEHDILDTENNILNSRQAKAGTQGLWQ